MSYRIVSILFLCIVLALSTVVYGDDVPLPEFSPSLLSDVPGESDDLVTGEVVSIPLQIEGIAISLVRIENLLQYQLFFLSFLSGALLAFVFLYGLRLR